LLESSSRQGSGGGVCKVGTNGAGGCVSRPGGGVAQPRAARHRQAAPAIDRAPSWFASRESLRRLPPVDVRPATLAANVALRRGLAELIELRSTKHPCCAPGSEACRARQCAADGPGPAASTSLILRSGCQGVRDEPMGDSGYQVMLNVSVPLYFATKQRSMVQQAVASREEAVGNQQASRLELVMRVRDEVAQIERAQEKLIALLEGAIIPQAQLTLASARSGYAVGRVDFPDVAQQPVHAAGERAGAAG
jgi:hypothetical protein